MANLDALKHFTIPKKRKSNEDEVMITAGPSSFPITNPGAGTSHDPGPELIKKARTMRFEGRLDKGGIGQQLVLAGFHQMSMT